MLSFFRKIRRSLIASHRVKNYFLYGVGEVVLVMIGILLALQINTWNQGRINKIEEKRILFSIGEEVSNYRWQVEVGLNKYKAVVSSSDQLIAAINQSTEDLPKSTIDEHLSILTNRWLFGMGNASNVYDALTGAGELGLVSSVELRSLLRELKKDLMLLASYETFQTNFVDNHLSPFLNQHLDGLSSSKLQLEMARKKKDFLAASLDLSADQSLFSTDYPELMGSQFFSNILIQHMKHTSSLIPIYGRLKGRIATIDSILLTVDSSMVNLETGPK